MKGCVTPDLGSRMNVALHYKACGYSATSRPMARMPRLIARTSGATPFHRDKPIGYMWQGTLSEINVAVSEL
jgi:hypothetical protein